ncbi:MAG: hypothetical protein H7301_02655 [Cryobacterium sp.]|nr:hypothetical protein [Oligoflexia bacterium]
MKDALDKTRADVTGFFRRAPKESISAPDTSDGRTLTAIVRQKWDEKVKPNLPAFASLKKKKSGNGAGGVPPTGISGSPLTSRNLNLVALIAAVLLIAWTGADLAAFYVEKFIPEPPLARSRGGSFEGTQSKTLADYQVIISRNLFSSLGRIPGDEVPGTIEQNNDPVKTSLPLNLIGTVILKNEARSVATLEDKGENQVYPVRVDDELPGKIKILGIAPYKVIFRNLVNGRKEFVDMPEEGNGTRISVGSLSSRKAPSKDGGIEQSAPNTYNIARGELDKYLSNINEVLTQARAIPHFENGQPAGFKLIQIVPGSVYEKLGLKNGDILKGVNGEPVDAAKAFEMMGSLKTASQLELSVQRDGKTSSMSYNFR